MADRLPAHRVDEPYFPWELVWPYRSGWNLAGKGIRCVTLPLTRWLGQDGRGNGHEGPPGRLDLASLACLASSHATQASAPQERARLRGLAAAHHIADLSPELADKQHVRRLLTQGEYDWLHVATHGGFIEEQTKAARASASKMATC